MFDPFFIFKNFYFFILLFFYFSTILRLRAFLSPLTRFCYFLKPCKGTNKRAKYKIN